MNELMISFIGGGYLYYTTKQSTVDKAFNEFLQTCEVAIINMDNMLFDRGILRNQAGFDIDERSLRQCC